MNTLRFLAAMTMLVAFIPATSSGQDKPRKGFLSVLKEDQVVTLKEVGGKYEITILKNAPAVGSKVLEVGQDFIVIGDAAGVTETRIHVTSIKAIVRLKIPKD